MNRFRKYISVVLLLAFSIYAAPKELVHELFHHDTEDTILCTNGEVSIGNAHEHCDLLQLTSPPFQHQLIAFTFCTAYCTFAYIPEQDNFYFKVPVATPLLRGPPLA